MPTNVYHVLYVLRVYEHVCMTTLWYVFDLCSLTKHLQAVRYIDRVCAMIIALHVSLQTPVQLTYKQQYALSLKQGAQTEIE